MAISRKPRISEETWTPLPGHRAGFAGSAGLSADRRYNARRDFPRRAAHDRDEWSWRFVAPNPMKMGIWVAGAKRSVPRVPRRIRGTLRFAPATQNFQIANFQGSCGGFSE
jgi:hypothetical protein